MPKIDYKQSTNKPKTFHRPCSHFFFCLFFPLGYSFEFWWEKQKLRLLKNDFVTGHFLHEKVIRIWSWQWSILSWNYSVWKCVQSLQSLIYAHMVPCIEFPCSVFRQSLHIHTGHKWFWDSYYHWIHHSDLSSSFSSLCWRKCKKYAYRLWHPSARNNSQPSFHKCLHFFANIAVFGTNNKRDSSNLETVTDRMPHNWLH
jgi:hypothetical protein